MKIRAARSPGNRRSDFHPAVIAKVQALLAPQKLFAQALDELTPLFVGETGTFLFGGEIWYLQK